MQSDKMKKIITIKYMDIAFLLFIPMKGRVNGIGWWTMQNWIYGNNFAYLMTGQRLLVTNTTTGFPGLKKRLEIKILILV